MAIKIYGSSDDLIEIEGDIREEFNFHWHNDDHRLLAVSDGTLLRIVYDQDGIWRITRLVAGSATYDKVEGSAEDDTPDVVTLDGVGIIWVVMGTVWAGVR